MYKSNLEMEEKETINPKVVRPIIHDNPRDVVKPHKTINISKVLHLHKHNNNNTYNDNRKYNYTSYKKITNTTLNPNSSFIVNLFKGLWILIVFIVKITSFILINLTRFILLALEGLWIFIKDIIHKRREERKNKHHYEKY